MSRLRLGQLDYINCLPVYYALEEGLVKLEAELIKGPPTLLNKLFLKGDLVTTPLSSIDYAIHKEHLCILPDLSISSDGKVASVLLFSKLPVTELEGRKVCICSTSATSVALLKVLFDHYYQVEVQYETTPPDLKLMIERSDAALLIGDDALLARQAVEEKGLPFQVTDLGEAWKKFTGEKMVYAVWVVHRSLAKENPGVVGHLAEILRQSKEIGLSRLSSVVEKAGQKTGLPPAVLEEYFRLIQYDFDDRARRSLLVFFDYAYKSGLIDERVRLYVFGEGNE